jgi:phage replication initiation protein
MSASLVEDVDACNRAERDSTPTLSSPRSVIRGETHGRDGQASADIAFVDWLAFTVRPMACVPDTSHWLRNALVDVFCVPPEDWTSKGRGWNGYAHRIDLGAFGLLAFGGEAQKGTLHVELNAQACRRLQDWNAARLWGETNSAVITRVDLAHDDLQGDEVSIDTALAWLKEGRFNSNGRPPTAQLIDDLGSNKGKTLYVGRRANGKFLRVYEKGKQLGDESSSWIRAEVELRNKGRAVPWDVVTEAGRYLAGAYPALRFLSAEQSRLRTVRRAGEISYASMVKNLRAQGGKSLHVMSLVHGGDSSEVLLQVVREGIPKRLAGYSEQELRQWGGGREP